MGDIFEDCYFSLAGGSLIIGNARIEHRVEHIGGMLSSAYLIDKRSKYSWHGSTREALTTLIGNPVRTLSAYSSITDNTGLSERHLSVTIAVHDDEARLVYTIHPGMPFISMRAFVTPAITRQTATSESASGIESGITKSDVRADCIYSLGICEKHLRISAIELHDVTDIHDMLVTRAEEELFHTRTRSFRGNIFVLSRRITDDTLMIVKEGPTPAGSLNRTGDDLYVHAAASVQLCGSGLGSDEGLIPAYGMTIGTPASHAAGREYARLYARVHKNAPNGTLRIMSNTWGDRNQDKAVNETFMLRECGSARTIGVDIVQIDDGWQQGASANSLLKKSTAWGSYYAADPDFWTVHKQKFPHGLAPLTAYTKENGFELGLWFSPDATDDYAAYEKDADVLLGFYTGFGIRHFKLDGIKLLSKTAEMRLSALLALVTEKSGGKATFDLDVTAQVRLGYLYEKQYGTIFVENRYSDWGNYFPHRTLKNLWLLAEFIPPRKFQFEVLNPRRNAEKYGDDPLAPAAYGIDYLFASVMVSNPLLWMEMQHLEASDAAQLSRIITVFRKERDALHNAEIRPIGNMPDGTQFTGFQAIIGPGEGYLILLREFSKADDFSYRIVDVPDGLSITMLASNDDGFRCEGTVKGSSVHVSMPTPRSYAFLRYTI
ncbi:MAG: alpha-galactosidase [Spirochaetota bacterium]